MDRDHTRYSIDDVLARTDLGVLLDEVAQPASSNPRGRRWHCPVRDHLDSNASVTMFTDARGHERWRCWSGDDNHRGDAIDLIIATRGTTRAEAITDLAQRAGLDHGQPLPPLPARPPSRPQGPRPLDPVVIAYAQACERILWSNTGRPVRDWLEARGLHEEVIRANHIGADPGRTLLHRKRGLPYGASTAATFPALDPNGNLRYLQARYLQPDPSGPKYDNPAGYMGSNPRVAWAVPTGANVTPALIVCEGIPDALTAAQAGHPAVGVLGAQAPDAAVGQRITARAEALDLPIIAIIDADEAGRAWGHRLDEHVDAAGGCVHLVEPPEAGLDLNAWSLTDRHWHDAIDATVTEVSAAISPVATERLGP